MELVIKIGAAQQVGRVPVIEGLERAIKRLEVAEVGLAGTGGNLGRSHGLDRTGQRQVLKDAFDRPVGNAVAAVILA